MQRRRTRRTSHIVKWNNKVCVSWKQVERLRCPFYVPPFSKRGAGQPSRRYRTLCINSSSILTLVETRSNFQFDPRCIQLLYSILRYNRRDACNVDHPVIIEFCNINPAYLVAEIALTETIRVSNNVKPGHEPLNFLSPWKWSPCVWACGPRFSRNI